MRPCRRCGGEVVELECVECGLSSRDTERIISGKGDERKLRASVIRLLLI
jgi:Zn ribbon nucleic-acid-binding protein